VSVEPEIAEEVEEPLVICERCAKPIDDSSNYVELVVDTFDDPQPFHRDPCSYQAREDGWKDPPIFIADMAAMLERYEHTVRRWVRESEQIFGLVGDVPHDQGFLPRELWPEREPESRKRIYWNAEQVDGLKEFADLKASRRGWHGASRGD
jgi:hypothetical protein